MEKEIKYTDTDRINFLEKIGVLLYPYFDEYKVGMSHLDYKPTELRRMIDNALERENKKAVDKFVQATNTFKEVFKGTPRDNIPWEGL